MLNPFYKRRHADIRQAVMRACKPFVPFERGIHAGEDAAKDQDGFPDCRQVGKATRRIPETLRALLVRMVCEPRFELGWRDQRQMWPIEQLETRLPDRWMRDFVEKFQPSPRLRARVRIQRHKGRLGERFV